MRKFNKKKLHSPFTDNIWDSDLVDMQLIINLIKDLGFYYGLLIFIDIYNQYAWVTNDFQKILKEPNRKPNKIWIDKGCEFFNRSIK